MILDRIKAKALPNRMPKRGYVQDPQTGVIRRTSPKVRGKAQVKAAKRLRYFVDADNKRVG